MFKQKPCQTCSTLFTPKGPAARYCGTCGAPSRTKEYSRQATRKTRIKQGKVEVGVGRGNSTANKARHGWTSYLRIGARLRIERGNKCERCEKDLTDAGPYEWVRHHRDHDRQNASEENIEILCKRCHQIEHECWLAFEGATTISKESSPKRGEAVGDPETDGSVI